ncbi:MAG TPA: MG2 domain-containing protein, partial [Ignavibacteriaceae bacterium]|nr:MG2 domain-containing protein [Ignavibacteriaceae bacterium]
MKKSSSGQRFFLFISFILPLFLGSSNQTIQNDNNNFYLSNYTTFSPGSEITVRLYTYGKSGGTFNFRLLKIEDPVGFFTAIDRNNMRYAFDIFGSKKEILLKYTSPVKEWKDFIASNYYGRNNNVDIGKISDAGIYILQAMKDDQVAYCGIVVSDLALVYKSSGKQLLAYVADARTGEFVLKSRISLYKEGNLIVSNTADADGLVMIDVKANGDFTYPTLVAQAGEETILSDPYFYFQNGNGKYYTAYVYTNQPVYRPGQHVYFKAILREKGGNEIKNVPYEKFSVSVKSPKNKEVFSSDLTTNEFGTLASDFILDDEADLGNYSITLSNGQTSYYGSFSVEEYKKPEYKVEVNTGSKNYASKDIIKGTVSADYYFGSPVTNGNVTLNIYKKQYWRPWWYWSDYKWFYSSYIRPISSGEMQLVSQETGKLDDNGEYEFSYGITDDVQYDYVYVVSAEVTDASRRVISGSSEVFVTRGAFSIFTSPDRYFIEKGKTVNIRVNANDFSDNPVQTNFDIFINYSNYRTHYNQDNIDILHGTTDKFGKASVPFNTSGLSEGYYSYTVKTHDAKNREITSSSSFYVGNINDYYYGRMNSGLEIVTDKDAYDKGDSLIAYIFLPTPNAEILLTYESDIFIKYKKYKVEGNNLTIREKLTDRFAPSFNISVCYLMDRQFYTTSKLIGVLAKDKFLDITLKPSKGIYKPRENAEYLVSVKDYKGNPVPNTDVSFGIIDESIYAIKEDEVPEIQSFFYAPTYSYIPTYCSLQSSNFSSSSRKVTYIDKYYFEDGHRDESSLKKASVFGKINIKGSEDPARDLYVILTSEKYYYSTKTDTNGAYKIGNIILGDYEVYISGYGHDLTLIKTISINKKSLEFNFSVGKPEVTQQVQNQNFNLPGTRVDEMSLNTAGKVADGMMKSAEFSKGGYVKPEIRSNFVDALIWKADVITDKNGEAKVSFNIPDNLTTWRTTVRGVTKQTEVGQQTDKIISRKDLIVRMETPRFFREGDELTVSTIVHNYLDEKKKTKITFDVENVELIGSEVNSSGYDPDINKDRNGVYEILVDKNGELRIDWRVKVNNPLGEAKLTAQALTNEESDAIELKVPILPKGIRETKPLVSDFDDINKTEVLNFRIPDDVDLRTAKLEFNLSPSLAGTIIKALDDLVGYPYGCVEQTMSRFLPTIIVANAF